MIRKLSEKCAVPKKEFSFENRGKQDLESNEREHIGHKVSLETLKVRVLFRAIYRIRKQRWRRKQRKRNERRKKI